jgi:hypothetical protein
MTLTFTSTDKVLGATKAEPDTYELEKIAVVQLPDVPPKLYVERCELLVPTVIFT